MPPIYCFIKEEPAKGSPLQISRIMNRIEFLILIIFNIYYKFKKSYLILIFHNLSQLY